MTNYEVIFYVKMENKKNYYIETSNNWEVQQKTRSQVQQKQKKKKNLKKVKSSKKHTRSTATATAKSLQSCPTL